MLTSEFPQFGFHIVVTAGQKKKKDVWACVCLRVKKILKKES